jgi:hypothetical protein
MHAMSLAEIEKRVLELSEEERREFASWFYRNQGKAFPLPEWNEEAHAEAIFPEVMDELLRRRREIDEGYVKTYSIEEVQESMRAAIHEVRHSHH